MNISEPVASILQITDLHILPGPGERLLGVDTEQSFHAVLDTAIARHSRIDLILLTGDLAQEPEPSSYRKIVSRLGKLSVPCFCLPGNHDNFELMQDILNKDNVSCRKQLLLNGWQLVNLNSQVPDSDGGRLAESELTFLADCLVRYPDTPTLVACHHHCRPTESEWMDTMIINNSNELLALVSRHLHAKAVICGHIHQIMDVDLGSIRLLGTPSTCFQFKPGSQFFALDDVAPGYRMLELFSDGRFETNVYYLDEKLAGLQFSGRY